MAKCSAENAKRTMSDMKDVSTEYPDDIRLLNFGEQIVTDTNEKFSIMDALVMASHGMLMRVEKCDDGKLLCAKIQANKITRKQYPGDFNKEIRALELMKMKKVENKFLPRLWGKGKTEDLTFYITDHVGQTLQRQLRRYKIGCAGAYGASAGNRPRTSQGSIKEQKPEDRLRNEPQSDRSRRGNPRIEGERTRDE